jgi:hypothetical protein
MTARLPSPAASLCEQAEREAEDYIRTAGVAEGAIPAARWADGICPAIIGASPVSFPVRAAMTEVPSKVAGRR